MIIIKCDRCKAEIPNNFEESTGWEERRGKNLCPYCLNSYYDFESSMVNIHNNAFEAWLEGKEKSDLNNWYEGGTK